MNIHDELTSRSIICEAVSQKEAFAIQQSWLETFASKVKKEKGKYVFRGLKWHGFSYDIQPCVHGMKAFTEYTNQWTAPYYVFDEELNECWLCTSETYPDLSVLHDDLYITHHNMKWTMVFTHEHPDLGPYFALKEIV